MIVTDKIQKIAIYLCALVPGFFSAAWMYTFGFTTYRHHLAFIGLPLGIVLGILAIGMVLLKRWAIIVSLALTILVNIASIAIFFLSRSPLYPAISVIGFIYIYSTMIYLRHNKSLS